MRKHLTEQELTLSSGRLLEPNQVDNLIDTLRHADALMEKTNVFLLYRAWSRREHLGHAAQSIAQSAREYELDRAADTEHRRVLDKFRDDLRAQMLHDLDIEQSYTGIDVWIRMSNGIARNLITTLKHVFDWASYHQEVLGAPGAISLRSQNKGVQDASNWFVNDAQVLGKDLGTVRSGLNRVCSLMRSLRFAEKPPECSLSTFEVDLDGSNPEVDRIVELSEKWSLFIRSTDRPERNSGSAVQKFRISGMVAPKYELPIFTRGSIHLSRDEARVIFSAGQEADYARILRAREARVIPPFLRGGRGANKDHEPELF